MDHLKQKNSRFYLNITVVLFTILFTQQSVRADSIYAFWQANNSSNQIFYSASYDGTNWFSYDDQVFDQAINSANISTIQPASAAFNDKLYVVWRSDDSYNRIYYSASSDGHTWPVGQSTNGSAHSDSAPAIVAFKDKLYVFFRASSNNNIISYIYSKDGKNWSPYSFPINYVNATSVAPAVTTDGNKLYVFWRENGSNNIYYSASSDGVTWPDEGNQLTGFTTTAGPAATYNKDLGGLYLVWKASDSSNHIMYSTSSDGSNWTPQQSINESATTSTSLAASAYNGNVYIAWKDYNSNSIFYSASEDGKTWPNGQPITTDGSTKAGPALAAPFSPDLSYSYMCYATNDSGIGWAVSECCQPSVDCGGGGAEDFSTGHNNEDPYSGTLDPNQNLQLTLQCGWDGKVQSVNLNHNSHINCSSSQDDKGTKIYKCYNKSDDNHHTWELKDYHCP